MGWPPFLWIPLSWLLLLILLRLRRRGGGIPYGVQHIGRSGTIKEQKRKGEYRRRGEKMSQMWGTKSAAVLSAGRSDTPSIHSMLRPTNG